jgi:dTDP-4-dehydrorhamnose 3,5-epimerase
MYKMKFTELKFTGCKIIEVDIFRDKRGTFKKIYHQNKYQENGLNVIFKEQYLTCSNKNVLRGMHFQLPPYDQSKLITCLTGSVLDVFLDLRKNSKTYGQTDSLILSKDSGKSIFLPSGIAHGFLSLEDNSGMLYSTSTVYNPNSDYGIMWNSIGYSWPINKPQISERDKSHVVFNQFDTPFIS